MYKDKNEENLMLSEMYNMFDNFNDKKEIKHLGLMANEQVNDSNSGDDVDDRNITKENEDGEEKYEVQDEVHDGLSKCSKCKVIKLLLYFLKQLQWHSSKIKSLRKITFHLSQENVKLEKSSGSLSNNLNVAQEKCILIRKEKNDLQSKCADHKEISRRRQFK